MHRQLEKCHLRRLPVILASEPVPPDFSRCTANLRAARLRLLPQMLWTAAVDLLRFAKQPFVQTGDHHETSD
jgi:hypothetical protein